MRGWGILELATDFDLPIFARPFLKWAGGKGQLLDVFESFYPAQLKEGRIKKYVEPFVGSGAVLLHVLQNYKIEDAYIFDINRDLINAYIVVRDEVENLVNKLSRLENDFLKMNGERRKEFYYEVRNTYNKYHYVNDSNLDIDRATQFIFLNRTCYNGLYRVNRTGFFNVPFGNYKNPTICDERNLRAVSALLQKVHIFAGDYSESANYIDKDTFVYFDPPYRPLSATSSFTSYSRYDFTDEEQIKLAQFFEQMNDRGAFLMLSNSDPKNVVPNDDFFDSLYGKFHIHRIRARRVINSKADGRGEISEILVTNYVVGADQREIQ